MGSFYATTYKTDCLQILYKFCKNWISVPNIVTLSLRCKYWKIHSRSNFQDAINSICCPTSDGEWATERSQWRHLSWSRSWQLERAYGRPFLTVFGEFEPQNVVGHRVYPQKALPYLTTRVLIHVQVTLVGESGKKINKKERLYVSRISPGALLRPIGTNFGLRVRLVDVINCAKFYRNRLMGLDFVRGRSLIIGLRCRH